MREQIKMAMTYGRQLKDIIVRQMRDTAPHIKLIFWWKERQDRSLEKQNTSNLRQLERKYATILQKFIY